MKVASIRVAAAERPLGVLLLLATVALLYGHTLQVPMYLDDHGAILGNHRLRDLPATLAQLFHQRGLTNLTFALNYRFTGWALAPLHLTNIGLHALCGVLVWLLLRQLVPGRWLPLLGALLFVAHPLQTQPVTYLVQRSAVLAGLLAVATVLCHRRARLLLGAGAGRRSWYYGGWQLGAVILGGAAILAKEQTVILPLLLMVHDRFFPLPGVRTPRQWWLDYLPHVVVALLAGGGVLFSVLDSAEIARLSAPLATGERAPLHYLVTQFSVLWIYLRLLCLPYGQALEHAYPLVTELWSWQNAVALAGLLAVGWLLWRLRHRRPLLVFGAAWFVLGLAVESSVIPLDPLFEHRLYLPMFGFVLALLDGVPALCGARRGWTVLALGLLLALPLSWRRNALWNEPLRFNQQNLEIAPASENVQLALIYNYRDTGRFADAERSVRALLQVQPRSVKAYQELALLQARRGENGPALATLEEGLLRVPRAPGLYQTAGQILHQAGDSPAALAFLRRGIASDPENPIMYDQLAALLFELGESVAAEQTFRQSLQRNGAAPATRRNLAKVLYSQGRLAEALVQLRIALQLEPGHPDTWEGLGMSALALGDLAQARAAVEKLERIDADAATRLRAQLVADGAR